MKKQHDIILKLCNLEVRLSACVPLHSMGTVQKIEQKKKEEKKRDNFCFCTAYYFVFQTPHHVIYKVTL